MFVDQSSPCRLYQLEGNKTIVEFPEGLKGKAEFHKGYEYYKEILGKEGTGIRIPNGFSKDYPELKDRKVNVIYLEDGSFGKAFYNVYFQSNFNGDEFDWEFQKK